MARQRPELLQAPLADGERGDGEAYVYVLAKTPVSPSRGSSAPLSSAELGASEGGGTEASLLYGPGVYQVDPWVTDKHNLRAAPRLSSPVVGSLLGGDVVDVAKAVMVHMPGGDREHWAQLVRKSPGPPAWALLASGGMKFLRYLKRAGPDGARQAGPDAAGRPQATGLDRDIAEQLGSVECNENDLATLIERITEHEWQLAGEASQAERFEQAAEETADKCKQKRAANVVKDLSAQAHKKQEAKKKKQRETWESERPGLSMRRVQQMATLEDTAHSLDATFNERMQQLREKREYAAALEESASGGPHTQADDEDAEVKKQLSAQDKAHAAAETAREAASKAARSLAGVSDSTLAECLVSMEAATANFYRKSVYAA